MPRRGFLVIMPIFLWAWFFVLGGAAQAAGGPAHLWQFDECDGDLLRDGVGAEDLPQPAVWTVGKWGCAINQSWQAQYYIEKSFSAPLPAGELTYAVYLRSNNWPNGASNHVYFKQADGAIAAGIHLTIYSGRTLYFERGATTTIPAIPGDDRWHLLTVTHGANQLAYYLDGQPAAVFNGNYAITSPITELEITGENWTVEMDELAIWPRALSAVEVADIYNSQAPLKPDTPPPPPAARLIHLWHFDEGAGNLINDAVGQTNLPQPAGWASGQWGSSLYQSWPTEQRISANLDQPINSPDLTLEFWWKNTSSPSEGRGDFFLAGPKGKLSIRPSQVTASLNIPETVSFYHQSIYPYDGQWHHLALVIDSSNYSVKFYIDGQLKYTTPHIPLINFPLTSINLFGENFPYQIDELAVWQGALSQAEIQNYYNSGQPRQTSTPDPVIIVPGIMGSWQVSGRWQLDPILHTYDNLMEALIAAGYKENSLLENKPTLFAFPYDWRADNNITANLLKEKIQTVKEITGRNKVDIIAHSLGGLVARSYIESGNYQNDINQVIFLGTPHQGSPESYLGYEGAYFRGSLGPIQTYLFQIEAAFNGYLNLTDYIRARVLTVEQLLPVYDYLKDKQPDSSYELRPYPLNYPQNNYLENLNSQSKVILLKQRARITNMVGDLGNNSTLNYLKVIADPNAADNKWQSGYPENLDKNLDSLEMSHGDGTVPLSSADSLGEVEVFKTGNSDHANLPTVMQKEIIKTLTGEEPTSYFNNKITSTIKRWAFFRVYSPVDLAVTAPDGKKIGKDFINSQEINQIPDAFYSGFGGREEFILIPNPRDGEYKIEVRGVDSGGEYTLANSLIGYTKEITKEFTGRIAPAEQRDFNINYAAASENPLGDIEPVDTAPPTIIINKPAEAEKYLHSDNLTIDYLARDDFSGLATTTITIDGRVATTTTIDLFDYSLGRHSLAIQAIDRANNQAQAQVNFEIIANLDSAIRDIKKIYERGGWPKGKTYRPVLINALSLLDIEARYYDKALAANEKLIKKTQDDGKIKDKYKQRSIEQYNKNIASLEKNRARAINDGLDAIIRMLNLAKKQNLINQPGYGIIISDINYLRTSL